MRQMSWRHRLRMPICVFWSIGGRSGWGCAPRGLPGIRLRLTTVAPAGDVWNKTSRALSPIPGALEEGVLCVDARWGQQGARPPKPATIPRHGVAGQGWAAPPLPASAAGVRRLEPTAGRRPHAGPAHGFDTGRTRVFFGRNRSPARRRRGLNRELSDHGAASAAHNHHEGATNGIAR
jgi:hypothetical protein